MTLPETQCPRVNDAGCDARPSEAIRHLDSSTVVSKGFAHTSDMVAVPTSKSIAHDLLVKWKAENRLIHATVAAGKGDLLFKIVCTLNVVNDKSIRLSVVKYAVPMSEQTFLDVQISRAKFEVIAAEDVPAPLQSPIAGHDSLLYVRLPEGVSVALVILPPVEELP